MLTNVALAKQRRSSDERGGRSGSGHACFNADVGFQLVGRGSKIADIARGSNVAAAVERSVVDATSAQISDRRLK